jgi:hypothetical protein
MNRDPALCRSFVRQAKAALSGYPHLKHEWSIDGDEDHCILDIPEESKDGFPITVEAWPSEITVIAGGAHMHYDLEGDIEDLSGRVLGLVRDLLSPGMRIRECLAGGKPYKWVIELFRNGQWVTEETLRELFFRWFGRRTEKIYQNKTLAARQDAVEHPHQPPRLRGTP